MNLEYTAVGLRELVLEGKGVSPGLAFSKTHVNARGFSAPDVYSIRVDQVDSEIEVFEKALAETREQLEGIRETVSTISGDEESQIFEAHIFLLEDRTLRQRVCSMLKDRLVNISYCYYAVIQGYMEALRRVEDSYLAERAIDLEDVAMRLLDNLIRLGDKAPPIEHAHVLIAYDLTPSDTVSMDRDIMLGFATEKGSHTSHTAILARSLGIPAVVGVEDAVMNVVGLANCILDGTRGLLIVNPSRETVDTYREYWEKEETLRIRLKSESSLPSETVDGRKITLSANVEFANEVDQLKTNGADGIGLFRTEFYLLESDEIPDEDQQAELYKEVVKGVSPGMTIFRTLDSGGDKMSGEVLETPEPNPFLGRRGIRFSLARPEIFKVQLRALLRATPYGKVGIMFPMVSLLSELERAKALLEECKSELLSEGYEVGDDYQVGVMIEIPSAALLANELAKVADFFSIGTNDLVQYTTAVDRVNELVSDLYRPADPGVLRLMKMTVEAGLNNGIWTGVCGEMASDIELLPLLIGMGIEELSVGVNKLPLVKSAIRKLNYQECREMFGECLALGKAQSIRKRSHMLARKAYPVVLNHVLGTESNE